MKIATKSTSLLIVFCAICIGFLTSLDVLAQRPDSTVATSKIKRISKTPQIKSSITPYKPPFNNEFSFITYNSILSSNATIKPSGLKDDKILTVVKIYPNPVESQVNLILRLDREINLSVKILDLLGNEIVTLSNERTASGEQTKTYVIPNRLNSGIYFLRISAGAETVVKRISVL